MIRKVARNAIWCALSDVAHWVWARIANRIVIRAPSRRQIVGTRWRAERLSRREGPSRAGAATPPGADEGRWVHSGGLPGGVGMNRISHSPCRKDGFAPL